MAKIWRYLFDRFDIKQERKAMESTTKAWWKDAIERLLWTFVQGALGVPLGAEVLTLLTDQEVAISVGLAMLAGGIGSVISLLKSMAATQLSQGGTAQLGLRTYSYTEPGPGSAGPDA